MKLDETFDSVNLLWQQLSTILFLHSIAIGLAVYAGVIPAQAIWNGLAEFTSLPELASLRENLQRIGLDLPLVAGLGIVVYLVLFQRLSTAVTNIPMFRLVYSETALWRAGKCFEELRELLRFFKDYTASFKLTDVEVTLGLAIAQSAKEYPEHHRKLVDVRSESAAVWGRYYSGFCLLLFASVVLLISASPNKRHLVLPIGLFFCVVAARCGWEVQIERLVLGRLKFAVDCGIIGGATRSSAQGEETIDALYLRIYGRPPSRSGANRLLDLGLAAELLKLSPPCLPYQYLWISHFARVFPPFRQGGSLPAIHNEIFRDWCRADFLGSSGQEPEGADELLESFDWPGHVPDDRVIVRLLRSRVWSVFGRWLAPKLLLIDTPDRYWRRPKLWRSQAWRDTGLRGWIALMQRRSRVRKSID